MSSLKKIQSALISVYHKEGLDDIITKLNSLGVKFFSTGGTQDFIEKMNIPVTAVESLTSYPSILGGRVKTLHPKVFGGILARRENKGDLEQLQHYEIPEIDLVIVDLYPFEETVASGAGETEIIEKIDIGGISLIRGAAKNFKDVVIISNKKQYKGFLDLLVEKEGVTSIEDRRQYSLEAFATTSNYDSAIYNYFAGEWPTEFRQSYSESKPLRYGENPHQKGVFFGDFENMFTQISGKEISYNNLLDIDAAVNLIDEFSDTTFAILKHNNACGCASRSTVMEAYKDALAGDPVSAFGGIFITNKKMDYATSEEVVKIFFEVMIAPEYDPKAIELLQTKKNLIILQRKNIDLPKNQFRSVLNGAIFQERDLKKENSEDLKTVTKISPAPEKIDDLLFANRLVKQSKSNTIVLAKGKQLLASGVGQTSRVDALRHAIEKAKSFGFDLNDSVMASDAFFPFPDCVEIADKEGIKTIIQPGGSIKDKLSIEYCDEHGMAMVMTGFRHFKH